MSFNEEVKAIALQFYREHGVKSTCERCYYLSDPTCPDFPHICMLEEALRDFGESRDWALVNMGHYIGMRMAHLGEVDESA